MGFVLFFLLLPIFLCYTKNTGVSMEYKFKIDDFYGPLDLLLHLIKESKMDILNIEIVKLTDQYLAMLNQVSDKNLIELSEYLVMASELAYLKSKSLLPEEVKEEDEEFLESKDNLVNRLLEYQRYKEVTGTLKVLEERRKEIFSKSPSSLTEYKKQGPNLKKEVSLEDLLKAFENFLKRKQEEKPLATRVTTKEISLEERTASIRKILKERHKVEFFVLFEDISKPYVVATFLSILEMAKKEEIVITQENNFDKIYVEARG